MKKKKETKKILHRHTNEVLFEYEGEISDGIKKAIKQDIDLRHATFRIINGEMWGLGKIDWKGKDLTDIDLRYCISHNSNFRDCNLSEATLCRSDFTGSDFRRANFKDTMMSPTIVDDCDFTGVNLDEAKFIKHTNFGKAKGVKK